MNASTQYQRAVPAFANLCLLSVFPPNPGVAIIMTIQFRAGFLHQHVTAVMFVINVLVLGTAGTVAAQTVPKTAPIDAPPRLERLEEGAPAGTSQTPNAGKGITESRDNSGAVTEIEVRTGPSTYYLRPNGQVGNAQPGDQQSSGNRAAQYRIKEFGLGRKKAVTPSETSPTGEETITPPAPSLTK